MAEPLIDNNWAEEHYVRRGDPNKPTYYIVRRRWTGVGLFSNFIVFADHIRYALSQGWIPVVDMQNYQNAYLPPEKLGKENSWEYYFEQPFRIGLEEAYSAENIVLCKENRGYIPSDRLALYDDKSSLLSSWRELVKQGLLKVKPEFMAEAQEEYNKLFAPTDRVLGVKLRGTDYVAQRPHGHPIPPPIPLAVETIRTKLEEWNCNKIFLATEDKAILEAVKEAFGDLVITYDRQYVDYVSPKIYVSQHRIDRPNDYFLQGKEYLIEMLLLTMCNSFVTIMASDSAGVMVLAEHFDNVFVFDLGRYP